MFGANDGLVSNLALVLGIGATGVPTGTVLFTGIAGLLAGALSMGAGEYVSVRSQRELLEASRPDPDAADAPCRTSTSTRTSSPWSTGRAAWSPRGRGARRRGARAPRRSTPTAPEADGRRPHEAVGTAWARRSSSFCFFASGRSIPVLPYLFGPTGVAAIVVAAVLVGLALLAPGPSWGCCRAPRRCKRALRQLAIGFGAAAATYLLGLVFGATMG